MIAKNMHIPSHLKHFSTDEFQNSYKKEIIDNFSSALRQVDFDFEDFLVRLNKLEKALFFKIGFTFCHYINDLRCEKCSSQTSQLRFLACIAVIESLLGNAAQSNRRIHGKRVKVPLVTTFLLHNLSSDEQDELSGHINIINGRKIVKSLFCKLKSLVDMRNGFMHRAELIRIGNDIGGYISIRRSHRGRKVGIISVNVGLLRLSELIKVAIIRYLLTAADKRIPLMRHSITN